MQKPARLLLRGGNRPGRWRVLPRMPDRLAAPLARLLVLVPFLLAACAAGGAPSDDAPAAEAPASDRPVRSAGPVEPVESESEAAAIGEVPAALLEQILANAADLADVDVEAIEVLRAESVTWNDGSLGCPERGMMYTQALVDGYHVVLDAGGTELDYRATENSEFRLCENPAPGESSGG